MAVEFRNPLTGQTQYRTFPVESPTLLSGGELEQIGINLLEDLIASNPSPGLDGLAGANIIPQVSVITAARRF